MSTSAIGYTVGQPDNHFSVSQIRLRRDGTISFRVKVPGPGKVDVLETAWRDNLAQIAVQLLRRRTGSCSRERTGQQTGRRHCSFG